VILEGMAWLGLDHDEGPFYQMQRMDRYKAVLAQLQAAGHVYPCYMSVAELDALRERQMAAKEKPRYDGTWRPSPARCCRPCPPACSRCCASRPRAAWWLGRQVKGRIEIRTRARRPGHRPPRRHAHLQLLRLRGRHGHGHHPRHPRRRPRQQHAAPDQHLPALGAPVPVFAHLPTVLNEQGEKMSKRNGAKAVTQYRDEGYLPDAMVNYLARLGWSHGDDEIFSRAVPGVVQPRPPGPSAGQFDEAKLRWVNAQHLKACRDAELAPLVAAQQKRGVEGDERLPALCAVQGPLRHHRGPGRLAAAVLRRRAAERRRPGQARHRRRQARPGQLGHAARIHAMDRPTSPPRSSRPWPSTA
jgi:glutamyl-tRNA synthetase